jgi:hypothetical protein
MKKLFPAVVLAASLILGCTPSDQQPPAAAATPTAAPGDQITDMDFESGEVEQPPAEDDQPTAEPTTPPVP